LLRLLPVLLLQPVPPPALHRALLPHRPWLQLPLPALVLRRWFQWRLYKAAPPRLPQALLLRPPSLAPSQPPARHRRLQILRHLQSLPRLLPLHLRRRAQS
jgi:hypothetical protein